MIYFLYSLVLAVAMLLSLPYWLYQMLRHGKYRRGFAERMGTVPSRLRQTSSESESTPPIWVHAVSLGEVLAVSGLIDEDASALPAPPNFHYNNHRYWSGTRPQTFWRRKRLLFSYGFCIRHPPLLARSVPGLVVIAETEFWPNFLRLAHASGARIAVVNARISDRSLPNYRAFAGLLKKELANVDLFLAQTEEDRTRLQSIGARPAACKSPEI